MRPCLMLSSTRRDRFGTVATQSVNAFQAERTVASVGKRYFWEQGDKLSPAAPRVPELDPPTRGAGEKRRASWLIRPSSAFADVYSVTPPKAKNDVKTTKCLDKEMKCRVRTDL